MNFFEKLLPKEGWYCTSELLTVWNEGLNKFTHPWKNRWFDNLNDAIINVTSLDAQGRHMYLAQATYGDKVNERNNRARTKDNVKLIKTFWFDIDCGPTKPYADQAAGCEALKSFVEETGLPFPCVIRSGNGLYAYWFLTEPIIEPIWNGLATTLKNVVIGYDFHTDNGLIANSACVLRPPGTTNRKNPQVEKPVVIIKDADEITLEAFKSALAIAAKKKKIDTPAISPAKKRTLNDEFLTVRETNTSSAIQIAEYCNQIRRFRDSNATDGAIPEPLWFNCIGVLWKTIEGADIIHEWSKNHPDYSFAETEQRIKRKALGGGATLCSTFMDEHPEGCIGCKYRNAKHVKTPIVLGETIAKSSEDKYTPNGFIRNENGIFFSGDDGKVHVYPWDVWPVSVSFDESVGYETVRIRHTTPFDGEKEFTMRTSSVFDPKAFLMGMCDNHVQVVGKDAKTCMVGYMENYMQHLRSLDKLSAMFCQMGWKENVGGMKRGFVLGNSIFSAGDEPRSVGLAKNVPDAVHAMHENGDISAWVQATSMLNTPEMNAHAFAFLAGAFGAPLLKFTGYSGAFVSLVGDSGYGKSLIQYWIMSAYGQPKDLMCQRGDTPKMLLSRLGVYGSLPMMIDEVTNMDPMELSEMVYRVTQGRDRGRLTQDARERASINSWNTLVVSSSNQSLVEKLSLAKANAGAEINRVFEIFIDKTNTFCEESENSRGRDRASDIYFTTLNNYGSVGRIFIQYIVDHYDEHTEKLRALTKMIDEKTGAKADERFWSAVAAVAIYGGLVAQKLGLIKFDVSPILSWVIDYIPTMRTNKSENISSPLNILTTFLDKFNSEILVVRKDKTGFLGYREIRGELAGRCELDTMRLYISKSKLKEYCTKTYTSMRKLASDLMVGPRPILIDHSKSKSLGAGVDYLASGRQQCWELDMSAPELGYVVATIVRRDLEERKLESVK